MPPELTDARDAAERAARDLLRVLADLPGPPAELRVAEVEGVLACLILVWDARRAMPVAGAERRKRSGGERAGWKQGVVEVVRAASRPLTRKEVVKALRLAGKDHGSGTVAKALADLTAAGELVNPGDKRGYRLPEWHRRDQTPGLF